MKSTVRSALMLLAAVFWNFAAQAGFDEGTAAYDRGDHATAFKE